MGKSASTNKVCYTADGNKWKREMLILNGIEIGNSWHRDDIIRHIK